MDFHRLRYLIIGDVLLIYSLFLLPTSAAAGVFELSAGYSYSLNYYSESDYEWKVSYSSSLGYHLTDKTEVEVEFQDTTDTTSIAGFQDTTFHDQMYSVDWVQSLTGKDFFIQPFFKLGVGELNRTATGSYGFGVAAPPAIEDDLSAILGAGFRLFFTRTFGLRADATTYLTNGAIWSWQQNFSIQTGLSIYF